MSGVLPVYTSLVSPVSAAVVNLALASSSAAGTTKSFFDGLRETKQRNAQDAFMARINVKHSKSLWDLPGSEGQIIHTHGGWINSRVERPAYAFRATGLVPKVAVVHMHERVPRSNARFIAENFMDGVRGMFVINPDHLAYFERGQDSAVFTYVRGISPEIGPDTEDGVPFLHRSAIHLLSAFIQHPTHFPEGSFSLKARRPDRFLPVAALVERVAEEASVLELAEDSITEIEG
ncbi:MAG: hypothetical protein ABII18_11885 [bacterium]|nr:hypothetical protein [bacterium]MBU1917889.1 hypothetical protein [bacterium]